MLACRTRQQVYFCAIHSCFHHAKCCWTQMPCSRSTWHTHTRTDADFRHACLSQSVHIGRCQNRHRVHASGADLEAGRRCRYHSRSYGAPCTSHATEWSTASRWKTCRVGLTWWCCSVCPAAECTQQSVVADTLIPMVYQALLTSAVLEIGHRIHTTEDTAIRGYSSSQRHSAHCKVWSSLVSDPA